MRNEGSPTGIKQMSFLMRGVPYCNIILMQMWISASLFGKVCHIFLPSTPTQCHYTMLLLSTYWLLLQEYCLYLYRMAGDHFQCGQTAEETYWSHLETFLLLPTGYHLLGIQFKTGLTFQITHSSHQRDTQKIVSHNKMNSPSHHRTALRPNVFLTGNTLITGHNI